MLVGSADKLNRRNPIPINMRLEMTQEAVEEVFGKDSKRVQIIPLDGLTDETDNSHDWGFYLYSTILFNLNH